MASIVYELQCHQRSLYNLEPLSFTRGWLSQLKNLDEQALFELSFKLVPRGGNKRGELRTSLPVRSDRPAAPRFRVR